MSQHIFNLNPLFGEVSVKIFLFLAKFFLFCFCISRPRRLLDLYDVIFSRYCILKKLSKWEETRTRREYLNVSGWAQDPRSDSRLYGAVRCCDTTHKIHIEIWQDTACAAQDPCKKGPPVRLVHRIFACISRKEKYEENYKTTLVWIIEIGPSQSAQSPQSSQRNWNLYFVNIVYS